MIFWPGGIRCAVFGSFIVRTERVRMKQDNKDEDLHSTVSSIGQSAKDTTVTKASSSASPHKVYVQVL